MANIFDKTISLIGSETFNLMQNKNICIVGLGGVGGTTFESLLRSGFSNFVIVDKDIVDITNLNRQILYTKNDVGKSKVEVATLRAKSINEEVKISPLKLDINTENIKDLDRFSIDFLVDAIDDVDAKIALYSYCLEKHIPFISSLGMGNRLDPTKVVISRLDKTEYDPLAKKIRNECRHKNINLKNINVVYSLEIPSSKKDGVNSMMCVPSAAGLNITNFIISCISKK